MQQYASKYYDSAKAHAYYMKKRQLKGRKKLTQAQKEAQGIHQRTAESRKEAGDRISQGYYERSD